MGEINSAICEAVDIIASKALKEAQYNKTVLATVVKYIDKTIGLYQVKEGDSIYEAYALNRDTIFDTDNVVYVVIPNSDYSLDKVILGSVGKYGTDYNISQYSINFYNSDNEITNGTYSTFINSDGEIQKVTVKAKPTLNGEEISLDEQEYTYYWFKEDASISDTSLKGYLDCAGYGWYCLNRYMYDGSTYTYLRDTNTFFAGYHNGNDFETNTERYLCCVVLADGTIVKNTFTLECSDNSFDISLFSTEGTVFYGIKEDSFTTDIICNVKRNFNNEYEEKYSWTYNGSKIDYYNDIQDYLLDIAQLKYNLHSITSLSNFNSYKNEINEVYSELENITNQKPYAVKNHLYNVPINSEEINISCQVSFIGDNEEIKKSGSSIITLNNYELTNNYDIELYCDSTTFYYDENKKLYNDDECTISYSLVDGLGHHLTNDNISDKIELEWILPEEEDSLLIIVNDEYDDYKIIKPNSNYDCNKSDNTIGLKIKYGDFYVYKELKFNFIVSDKESISSCYWINIKNEKNQLYPELYLGNNLISDDYTYSWSRAFDRNSTGGFYDIAENGKYTLNEDFSREDVDKAVDIFKVEIAYNNNVFKKFYTLPYLSVSDSNYEISYCGGCNLIKYTKDGTQPVYVDDPLEITIIEKSEENDISEFRGLSFNWSVVNSEELELNKEEIYEDYFIVAEKNSKHYFGKDSSGEISLNLKDQYLKTNAINIIPTTKYSGFNNNQAICCTITLGGKEIGYLHYPIAMVLNADKLNNIDYNGMEIKVGDYSVSNIQEGFGTFTDDNFNGILFGEERTDDRTYKGLLGYTENVRTTLIDSLNGDLFFGNKDKHTIQYDSTKKDLNSDYADLTISLNDGSISYEDNEDNAEQGVNIENGILKKGLVGSKTGLKVSESGFIDPYAASENESSISFTSNKLQMGDFLVSFDDFNNTIINLSEWKISKSETTDDNGLFSVLGPKDDDSICQISEKVYIGDVNLTHIDNDNNSAKTGYLLIEGQTNHKLFFRHGLFVGWAEEDDDEEAFENLKDKKGILSIDGFLLAVIDILKLVASNTSAWAYGNSSTLPPCGVESGIRRISCDRLVTFALYRLGFRKQREGGYTLNNGYDTFLTSIGFKKTTDKNTIKKGSVVVTNGGTHTFVAATDITSSGTCCRYDFGTDNRIKNAATQLSLQNYESVGDVTAIYSIPSTEASS